MDTTLLFAQTIATAFLAGSWSASAMLRRGTEACGARPRWLRGLARRVHEAFPAPTGADLQAIGKFIYIDLAIRRNRIKTALLRQTLELPHRIFWVAPEIRAKAGMPSLDQIPQLATTGALADWLDLEMSELEWFADCQHREAKTTRVPLRHYSYRWLSKRGGSARLLEMPKQRLKSIQRRVLHEILDRIPPHDAAHGYRLGRSIASFVAPHAGRDIVLHFDLRDFFPSIRAGRIHALFRTIGYPPTVARFLTGLCTNVVPEDVWQDCLFPEVRSSYDSRKLYGSPHLPQGAPTSPALANLCAYRFDCRLAAMAQAINASFTRYADDLAFSGGPELERATRRFQVLVCRIALEEGFEIHTRKSRFMRQGVRQQLTGVVLNVRPNVPRLEYDRLKAILHNCGKNGFQAENRDNVADFRGRLLGRISHLAMIHPVRGRKLRESFDRVEWEGTEKEAEG